MPKFLDWWVNRRDLRDAWRNLYRTGPPMGLSRDLLIRALANQLQERAHGGASRVLRRRLQKLAGEYEKGGASVDPGTVLKTGTTLVDSGADTPIPCSFARTGSSMRASVIAR